MNVNFPQLPPVITHIQERYNKLKLYVTQSAQAETSAIALGNQSIIEAQRALLSKTETPSENEVNCRKQMITRVALLALSCLSYFTTIILISTKVVALTTPTTLIALGLGLLAIVAGKLYDIAQKNLNKAKEKRDEEIRADAEQLGQLQEKVAQQKARLNLFTTVKEKDYSTALNLLEKISDVDVPKINLSVNSIFMLAVLKIMKKEQINGMQDVTDLYNTYNIPPLDPNSQDHKDLFNFIALTDVEKNGLVL